MRVVVAGLAIVMLAACTNPSDSAGGASAARSAPSSASAASASPSAAQGSTSPLTCTRPVTATHGLALFEVAAVPLLEVLDVSNPVKPVLLCMVNPAEG
ncbi:MAG TPA: hypothetical protein VGG90_09455, partial [Candidatus Dormibacteraeota bacterium]